MPCCTLKWPLSWFVGILLTSGVLLASHSFANDNGPVIPQGKGEQCVADTAVMRRDHMEFILHQRDRTVIQGIRDEPFSLVECVNCHARDDAEGIPIRVDAEGEFCQSCHAFAAVKIDCFGCHAAVPHVAETKTGSNTQQPEPFSTLQARLAEYLDGHTKH